MIENKLYEKEKLAVDLQAIGNKLAKPMSIYLIGGCAMSFKNLKSVTKDVDIIFTSIDELKFFEKELLAEGYLLSAKVDNVYAQLGAYSILRHPEKAGFDLFFIKVCNMLILSKGMAERATKYSELGRLSIYLISNEDIVLFKAITERPRDLDDMFILISASEKIGKFDWNILKEECKTQSENLKIEGHLFNRMQELFEKYGVRAPISSWLKNRDKKYVLQDAYEIRLKNGFTHEQIMAQFRNDGFSKKEMAFIETLAKNNLKAK